MVHRFDTQTCENDTFACEIHTPECRFLNIFLLRHTQFFRTHAWVWFWHARVHTHACDFHTLHNLKNCRASVVVFPGSHVIFQFWALLHMVNHYHSLWWDGGFWYIFIFKQLIHLILFPLSNELIKALANIKVINHFLVPSCTNIWILCVHASAVQRRCVPYKKKIFEHF
jgi:hypothetical protein